jgi:hypothetical protein
MPMIFTKQQQQKHQKQVPTHLKKNLSRHSCFPAKVLHIISSQFRFANFGKYFPFCFLLGHTFVKVLPHNFFDVWLWEIGKKSIDLLSGMERRKVPALSKIYGEMCRGWRKKCEMKIGEQHVIRIQVAAWNGRNGTLIKKIIMKLRLFTTFLHVQFLVVFFALCENQIEIGKPTRFGPIKMVARWVRTPLVLEAGIFCLLCSKGIFCPFETSRAVSFLLQGTYIFNLFVPTHK